MHMNDIPMGIAPHRALPRIRLSPEIWDAIRDRYHNGESAEALSDLFGISLSSFRVHAREGGWRRMDSPDPIVEAPPTPEDLARDERPNIGVMADIAMRRAARAVREGRLTEARGWTRVGRSLAAAARRERPGRDEA
ncbi:MAG TPA: hypothetical protein PLE81_05155 [Brevundimonas sp.]|uniref:hypothetical protein n=1 Tax=Brevundimonas sp. TaxID=1871086 RepID=UPI002CA5246E|nr:hypothetical protein [Brevundimonas sp.]HRH20009.1 hypothetical protein [Brevundimonas sp.]